MIFEYDNFQILEVNGLDTQIFLQGLVTSDLNILSKNNNFLLTAFTNLKGRIISLCFIKFISNDRLLISVEKNVAKFLILWLKKYSIFSKVSCNINNNYSLFFTKDGFLNHMILKKYSLKSNISFDQVQKENIFNKLAIINSHNSEQFLPSELELDNIKNVICYTKGCYLGQEVIARIHYKTKLKKKLAVVKSRLYINEYYLRDINNKLLATVVNKIFINNECYMLVVFYKESESLQQTYDLGYVHIIVI